MMLLLMITLIACGKDGGSDGPSETPAKSYLRGTADGIPFNATTFFVTFSNSGDDDITIRGDWPGGYLRMQVAQDPAIVAGVYPFESGKLRNATYFEVTSWNAGYMCGALPPCIYYNGGGEIRIDEIGPSRIRGRFQFTGDNGLGATRTITDGVFDIRRTSY
jgi:hypothetical protein